MTWIRDVACIGEDQKCKALIRKLKKETPWKTQAYAYRGIILRKRV
jgi:hypothetical protein